MKVYNLSLNETAAKGYTHKAVITHADLSDTAGTGKALAVFPESGNATYGAEVRVGAIKVTTAFSGGSVSALTVSIGDSGSATRNCAATSVFTGAAGYAVPSWTRSVIPSSDKLLATFASTSANLSALTAGEMELYLQIVPLPELAR